MIEELNKELLPDEKLLFHGTPNINKTDKQYMRFVLGVVLLIIMWIVFASVVMAVGGLNKGILGSIIALIVLSIALIYGFIYNLFLKNSCKKNEYFITNKRIALYTPKNGFRFERITKIERIGILRRKDIYADVIFSFKDESLINQMKNTMCFNGVENPDEIVSIINDYNKYVQVYNDNLRVN